LTEVKALCKLAPCFHSLIFQTGIVKDGTRIHKNVVHSFYIPLSERFNSIRVQVRVLVSQTRVVSAIPRLHWTLKMQRGEAVRARREVKAEAAAVVEARCSIRRVWARRAI